jgi:hypothetical protein
MSDILDQLRAAFDGDDIPRKNIALRKAHDEIKRLHAEVEQGARWRRQGEAELRAEIEQLRLLCADTIKHLEEAEAEIEQLKADQGRWSYFYPEEAK